MDLVVLAGARRRLPDKILNSGQGLLATALDSEDATDTSARTAVPCVRSTRCRRRPVDGSAAHLALGRAPTLPTVVASPRMCVCTRLNGAGDAN